MLAGILSGPFTPTYDLSGFANAQVTVAQMITDQRSGAVKFAGGSETWLDNPRGLFTAVLQGGGSAVTTTTNNVRALLTSLRATFDALAASPGTISENAAIPAALPPIALQAGTSSAIGPIVDTSGTVQATAYDLSGIGALQATANQMLADQQSGAANFVKGPIPVVLTPGGPVQSLTMVAIRGHLARLRLLLDQLAQ
jgi:hypothetical protein